MLLQTEIEFWSLFSCKMKLLMNFQLYETGQEHHHVSKAEHINILSKVIVPIYLKKDI